MDTSQLLVVYMTIDQPAMERLSGSVRLGPTQSKLLPELFAKPSGLPILIIQSELIMVRRGLSLRALNKILGILIMYIINFGAAVHELLRVTPEIRKDSDGGR